jgi:hypothetical protein
VLYFVYLQELLYLYGFVVDNNPDDYLMVTLIMMYVLKDNNLEFLPFIFVANEQRKVKFQAIKLTK